MILPFPLCLVVGIIGKRVSGEFSLTLMDNNRGTQDSFTAADGDDALRAVVLLLHVCGLGTSRGEPDIGRFVLLSFTR